VRWLTAGRLHCTALAAGLNPSAAAFLQQQQHSAAQQQPQAPTGDGSSGGYGDAAAASSFDAAAAAAAAAAAGGGFPGAEGTAAMQLPGTSPLGTTPDFTHFDANSFGAGPAPGWSS
jgi:hypothetical protein